MLSKKQKTIMAILGSIGILFGLIVAIPFRSFPGLNKIENILTIELAIKLVLGVLSILLAVYPLMKKYKLINGYRENSKTIIIMTYFPIFTYILGSVVNIIYTLSFDYASAAMLSALSDKVLGIIVSILTVYLIFTIYCIVRIHAIVAKLDKVSNILFDSFMLVIHLCFVGLLWRANNAYNQLYSVVDEYFVGNPLLFVIYLLLVVAVGCGIKFITITIKKDESLSGDDVREGLTAIVSCKISDPQFEGQTKTKLGNTEVRRIVSQAMSDKFEAYLLENPANAKMIIEKSLLALRARLAAKKAREATRRKSPLDSLGFASKLSDCRTKDPQLAEMYIVEGDSAGGSAKMGRESYYQAILPLRGKVLNVEKAALSRALSNKEILSMIQAIGTGIGNEFQIENARYHKIVIMTDADVDGAHIRTLLLTFFYRFMRPIIEKGYVYIAQPPLYKIQQGKKIDYAYSDEELNFKLSEISGKRDIQRYKGLGEMNAEQLWETTMDPKKRILLQVTLNDGEKADEVFSMLMGEDVEPRRKFIEENAVFVQNLDV